MSIQRIADAYSFTLLNQRASALELQIRRLQEQVTSGVLYSEPGQNPAAAAHILRSRAELSALAKYDDGAGFGVQILGAQDTALADATSLVVRAEEIAAQMSSGLVSAEQRFAAAEEVHGILEGLTLLGNGELSGRRLFGGLALDSAVPFADPDSLGYDPANAYSGSTQEFSVKIGAGASERVRLSTDGDAVFEDALVGVAALETALRTNGDVAGTVAGLIQGRNTLGTERASVGARQAQLVDRQTQVGGSTLREQTGLAEVYDTELVLTISKLVQVQTALQATLQAATRVIQTNLTSLVAI
jgi:flagellin-like hook-associated protein FlgL